MSIRASASSHSIVPDEMLPLAGYRDVQRDAEGEKDPICASAIHIRSGGAGLVVMALDVLSIDPSTMEKIRAAVMKATSTPKHNLFLGITQTHSAPEASRSLRSYGKPGRPEMNGEFIDLIVEKCVSAASESCVLSRPASIAILDFDTPNTGAVLIRDNPSGRIAALIIVHEDIPDYLGKENKMISSDFIGAARKQLAARFGGDPVVCFYPSPQGTRKLTDYDKDTDRGSAADAGKALSEMIIAKTKTLKKSDFVSDIKLKGDISTVFAQQNSRLPDIKEAGLKVMAEQQHRKELLEKAESQDEIIFANWSLSNALDTLGFAMSKKDGILAELQNDYKYLEVQRISIGDVNIVGLPCTITADCANHISSQTDKRTWVAECVNGNMEGSILDADASSADTCGLLSPIFGPENGKKLLTAAMDLVKTNE